MGWFDWLRPKQPEVRSIENPTVPISAATTQDLWGDGLSTPAGQPVTVDSAIRQTVVFTCVRVLAESIAVLPWQVYKREQVGKSVARDHPLYVTLHDAPNTALTSFVWRETLMALALFYGNSYAWIQRRPDGSASLLLLPSPAVRVVQTPEGVFYEVRDVEGASRIAAKDMLHIPGLSLDGLNGISLVLKAGRDAISTAMAADEHTGRFFSNGARVGGVLSTDQVLSDIALARLKGSWGATQQGVANAYKTAVLEQGLKYQAVGLNSDHAQLVETRRLQTELIAGLFRIPPIFVGDYSQSHYANAEHSDLHFAKHTLSPWCSKIEQEVNKKLFADDPDHFCEFNMDGMLRGDFTTRMNGFAQGIQSGIYTPNEVRSMLNLPPKEGGDNLFIQQNMASTQAVATAAPKEPAEPGKRELPQFHAPQEIVLRMSGDDAAAFGAAMPAPVVNVAAPNVHTNVQPPVVHVAAPDVTVAAPSVTVAAPNVTVAAPEVRVSPQINVEAPKALAITKMPRRKTTTKVTRNAAGDVTDTTQTEQDD